MSQSIIEKLEKNRFTRISPGQYERKDMDLVVEINEAKATFDIYYRLLPWFPEEADAKVDLKHRKSFDDVIHNHQNAVLLANAHKKLKRLEKKYPDSELQWFCFNDIHGIGLFNNDRREPAMWSPEKTFCDDIIEDKIMCVGFLAVPNEHRKIIDSFVRVFVKKVETVFSGMTDDEFEAMCFDLLYALQYTEVHSVGRTRASDGGKDVLATEVIPRPHRAPEKRLWIWQFKSGKTGMTRKDFGEIPQLLKENDATCYGLFCANYLTPGAVMRLESIRKDISPSVLDYRAARELRYLVRQFPHIVEEHDLNSI